MKNRSSSPPLHVHVDENTPVHVHIKKGQKTTPAKCQQKQKARAKEDGVRAVRLKTKAPWVPPGKARARDTSLKWEESSQRLEITPDSERMRLSELSTDDDDAGCSNINKYEKKLDNLMSMVGTLNKEVKLQKMGEQGQMAKRLLEEQKEELNEVTQELVQTENENTRLRRNIERIREEKDLTLLQKECLQQEKECLMSKLSDAERDGAAAARQIHVLKNTIGRLNMEKHMNSTDISALTRQKKLLLQKLSTFEETNRTLRELLAEQRNREKENQKVLDRQAVLLKRLAESDAENMELRIRLQEKEKEVDSLTLQIESEKDQAKKVAELTKTLESLKAHFQAQLRSKEAENNQLTTQLQSLERSEAQLKEDLELALDQLKDLRQKGDGDKEALKKAVRAQKERAERSEEYVQKLTAQLAEKDSCIVEARSNLESWRNRCNKAVKEKSDAEMEIVRLNSCVADLTEQLAKLEEKMREDRQALVDKLHQQTAETNSLKKDNDKLRVSDFKAVVGPLEEKFLQAEREVQQLQTAVRHYEEMVANYSAQASKAQEEVSELAAKLERSEKEKKAIRDEMNQEIEMTRRTFQSRLAELEKLPEILKYTETQLAECQEQLKNYEKKSVELSATIAELRQRIELQGEKMEMTRERYKSAQEDKKQLTLKVEELERKLETTSAQNIEFLQVIAKREESIHQCQLRLEEKTRECSSLARQLEMAIEDAKKQVEQTRERALSRERTAQSKLLDLETQLSRTKSELNQLRRSKDDAERRFESRLQDLKDRLEQSESTNRSMQNYVHFLKSSYDSVFREGLSQNKPNVKERSWFNLSGTSVEVLVQMPREFRVCMKS
ncbi:Outer dense fiber protein 2 [Willisornis vidua]|uniref:Outer dense fiber protein 2 n=1 Tax=Willisornis vidua TaxID=1566151 RepID=A0ABQ9D7M1_9PASS|nr:Outer dense fiber protein 2 [Willisornis vidua]